MGDADGRKSEVTEKRWSFWSSFFYVLMGQCFWWIAVLHILQNFYNNIIPDLLWNDVIKDDFG